MSIDPSVCVISADPVKDNGDRITYVYSLYWGWVYGGMATITAARGLGKVTNAIRSGFHDPACRQDWGLQPYKHQQ
jgi:hypothetical protein